MRGRAGARASGRSWPSTCSRSTSRRCTSCWPASCRGSRRRRCGPSWLGPRASRCMPWRRSGCSSRMGGCTRARATGSSRWASAAISGFTSSELAPRLEQLVRGDLVHVEIDPRSPERGQYAFVQALIREVAYSTLALRDRRSRHLAAARYFEGVGDDELSGALAAHYVAAFRASSEGPEADALKAQARLSLRAAAARAEQLGALAQAVAYLRQAAEIAVDDADRAEMLEQAG